MATPLTALILEDRASDMELMLHELRRGGFDVSSTRAENEDSFLAALDTNPEIILADFNLPQFDALRALQHLRNRKSDIPLIVVTGHLSDESAVECIKQGASDYLIKDRLARLPQAVGQALAERQLRQAVRAVELENEAAQLRMQAIFRNTRDAIFLADDGAQFLEANPTAELLTGRPLNELTSMALWDVALEPSSSSLRDIWAKFRTSGDLTCELEVARNDGTVRLTECEAIANIVQGTHLVVFRDITDKRKTEAALLHAQKLESLGVLAGGVAHDFNNLLVAVLGNADLALIDLPPESPAVDSVRQIKAAARRAADLARQMLALSGRGLFVVERLDLNFVVDEMTHLLKASIARGALLRYNLVGGLPHVKADATQIRQIIMNLVVNASDAIGNRSGIITVTTGAIRADRGYLNEMLLAPELPEGDYVYLEVSDNGTGMDSATLRKIFDPFFTTKFTGRGLGLAAVLGIIRSHGGAIKVYSELGKGTTFKVLLPVAESSDGQEVETPAAPAEWRGSGRVLIVDDDESVRTLATRLVERLGFTVTPAEDGLQAVALFRDLHQDLTVVLLDLTMPHLGGEDTFRELRRISTNVPVIVMSGYNESETTMRFAGKGLAGFIQKPFEYATLRSVIRHALERDDAPAQTLP
ncbi:hypothetical protein AYO38_06595 [bacterium SCGC AG-212-C10]|nr:hypothetical protein AYO38_06595 [bacterium SCGC AG-212-C10]